MSYALHQPGKPDVKRAEHLGRVTVPMLFLSGTRDELADLEHLQPVYQKLRKRATLHLLDTADHGYRVLKRERKSDEDVFVEMARAVAEWASRLYRSSPNFPTPPAAEGIFSPPSASSGRLDPRRMSNTPAVQTPLRP